MVPDSSPSASQSALPTSVSMDTDLEKPMLPAPPPALAHISTLARHIATQGLMKGAGSDITLKVFNKTYRLHRLILTQSVFFETMLQGPWKERAQDVVEIQIDDPNITQEGFEIAIGKLYGVWTEEDDRDMKDPLRAKDTTAGIQNVTAGGQTISATSLTSQNALAVLAAGAYLGIDVLCELCTTFVIRTLSIEHILEYVQFTHNSSYYPWSGKIAEACRAYLCRNGFDDPKMKCLQVFEGLPASWLLNVIGSDAFWVPNEWERYKFCRQTVYNRRKAIALLDSASTAYVETDDDEAVYEALFSTSIVYMHMTFEQLQVVMQDRDPISGQRFTHAEIVHEALWQQTEMRTLIEQSNREDGALDVVVDGSEPWKNHTRQSNLIPDQDRTIAGDANDPVQRLDPVNPLNTTAAGLGALSSPRHSLYAPFRFSVEFGNVHSLQENVRVYSDVIFYAGSYWNVYIQKLSSSKGLQLGVYLHRHSLPQVSRPSKRPNRSTQPSTEVSRNPSLPFAMWTGWGLRGNHIEQRQPQQPSKASIVSSRCSNTHSHLSPPHQEQNAPADLVHIPDLPDLEKTALVPIEESFSCHIDKRDNTRTWFKIFAASQGPSHTVMQFQSSPDDFMLMQSWGWRSSSLCTAAYMPNDSEPANDEETKFRTACASPSAIEQDPSIQPKTWKGKQVDAQLDMSRRVADLAISDHTPVQNHRARSSSNDLEVDEGLSPMGVDDDVKDGHESAVAQIQIHRSAEVTDPECSCVAQETYGRHHHHHPLLPLTLKFSIVMGVV
ncbi:hypothetical protein BC939DRAFT_503480 [Gamsiella multidivaricata]|uniref:uncharacterized protein n=1 Tax=Gamsiella multidivaricata TaxID=101098 RepID=UPI00221ED882|nr:uncharacterized protein BC939DRAFT_503480 [Gamsiella multidivaricata]KAI7823013.1 hypothetical protein BC939DRAFT_503480 [Gamsiella multidivaricata]